VGAAQEGADSGAVVRAAAILRGVHRIFFLGDSITQAGDYVTDCECWLLAHGFQIEILNLGLGSETASDLTSEENAAHLKTSRRDADWRRSIALPSFKCLVMAKY
jgi:hypothetical protein